MHPLQPGREFAIPKPFSILNPRSDLHLDKSLNIVIFLVNINADGINRIYTYSNHEQKKCQDMIEDSNLYPQLNHKALCEK